MKLLSSLQRIQQPHRLGLSTELIGLTIEVESDPNGVRSFDQSPRTPNHASQTRR